ncbi:MAG TPA: ATP-binding protein [Acidimicrobiales bacterium]|nr:ATP-binding protein [Acidimicrobiales bacterium]
MPDAGPDPDEAGAVRSGRRLVALQVGQFAAAGLVALAIVAVATSIASRRIGEREAISDARTTTVIRAQEVVTPALSDGVLHGDPDALARLDEVVQKDVLDASLVRVKLWRGDGTIVYADQPALVGTRWALGPDERRSVATGRIDAEVSDLTKPENRYERAYGKLLEVYLPVRTPAGEVLLFEAYYRYGLVASNGRRLWRSFAPISLGGLVMLGLVQLLLAWSLARRLRHRLEERERLLRRTLEVSEIERRQIAGDLHDGVVQDLAGVALALSAATRRPPDSTADGRVIAESAEAVRGSIKSLRSLLVDIYPPDFAEVSLESALADLLARAADRGVATHLSAGGLVDPVPDAAARLVYRVAQEGLRNVVDHAGATTVTVSARTEGAGVSVEVSDDGQGFDTTVLAERQAAGHLGLTAMRGLVADAGGTLVVQSAPGEGTVVRATVPCR